MKKIILISAVLFHLNAYSQVSKWFVSVSTGGGIGGPSASLKKQMISQNFNQTAEFDFLGLTGTHQYPDKYVSGYTLVRFGKLISKRKSLFFIAGRSEKGEVTGFRNEGYADFLGLFGSSSGPKPTIKYSIYQLSSGFQYDCVKTTVKLGLGPSLFLMDYKMNEEASKSALVPGVIFTGRFPFGKERKLIGLELVTDIKLAAPVKMKTDAAGGPDSFTPGKVNMCSISAGIALCFRR